MKPFSPTMPKVLGLQEAIYIPVFICLSYKRSHWRFPLEFLQKELQQIHFMVPSERADLHLTLQHRPPHSGNVPAIEYISSQESCFSTPPFLVDSVIMQKAKHLPWWMSSGPSALGTSPMGVGHPNT